MLYNQHSPSRMLVPRIMLLLGLVTCFLFVVVMRTTPSSSQHRSCMQFQKVISPNDIVYFCATEFSWESEHDKIGNYNVESESEPELLNSDNSAKRSTLDILKTKFDSLSLDTTFESVEEIWREYIECQLDYSTADFTSKDDIKTVCIGPESDVVLKFRAKDLKPFKLGDRIEVRGNLNGMGGWNPATLMEKRTPDPTSGTSLCVTFDNDDAATWHGVKGAGWAKKEHVRRQVSECHYFVFGKHHNPLNPYPTPCEKCNGSGRGRFYGECSACKGISSNAEAFIQFLIKEKGIIFSSSSNVSRDGKGVLNIG